MNRAALFALTLAVLWQVSLAQARQGSEEQAIMDRLAGNWRLVRFDVFNEDGEAERRPYSLGRVSYSADGLMAEQLIPDGWGGDIEADYYAYFGAYSVDLSQQALLHHVEGAYNTQFLGRSMPRFFVLSEGDNILTLEVRDNGRPVVRVRLARILLE